jgi:hypothetical protein
VQPNERTGLLLSQTATEWQLRRENVSFLATRLRLRMRRRMRNQTLGTVLFFLLSCVPGFAQPVEKYTEHQFLNSCAIVGHKLLSLSLRDRDGKHVDEEPVWLLPNKTFFFTAGMTIDADGAPNAYHPDDTGIDELANAGWPGHWNGIITDRHGIPLIQREADPFPGYYISCTSLADKTKEFNDTSRYVDATKIPYVALPEEIAESGGARLGDFALVINLRNGKSSFAIYADIGTLGEGSVALAERLGISPNARYGGESDGVLYMFFPGSGNMKPRIIGEIQSEGERLLSDLGGIETISHCSEDGVGPTVGSGEF